jgi:uncharacterized protein YaeQ
MALTSTLHRFKINLADIDRGIYENFELRIAQHPSETPVFLLTRVIAFILNRQEGLAVTQGIAASEEPALWVKDLTGTIQLWIDIGHPSAKRLHKAAKASPQVRVYMSKSFELFKAEIDHETIYRKSEIEFFVLSADFLKPLEKTLNRDNTWDVLISTDEFTVTVAGDSIAGEITSHHL